MRLPRLLPFRRAKPSRQGDAPAADGLELARAQAMERMRARFDAPEPPPAPEAQVSLSQQATATAPAADPLQGLRPDTATGVQPEAAQSDPLAGVAEAAATPAEGPMDPGLLDIFRDVREETEEGGLASEIEDVPIGDLMSDLMNISDRLGISPAARKRVEAALALEPEAAAPSPALVLEEDVGAAPATGAEPELAPPAAAEETSEPPVSAAMDPIDALTTGAPEPSQPPEDDDADGGSLTRTPGRAQVPAESGGVQTAGDGGSSGRRYALHVLFLGLAFSLAAGLGVQNARAGSLVNELAPTPAVLADIQPPVVPQTVTDLDIDAVNATPAPTPVPTASPNPTPSPTPAPTPMPYVFKQPAYFMYTVESGDSLTSIATAFDMCPDHILWNNPGRREEDPLMAGDKMLLPGIRGIIHRVQPGDTVESIAGQYSVRPENILGVQANHLVPGQAPTSGSRLLVPDGIPPPALLRDAEDHEMTHTPSWYGYVWPFYGPITTFYGEQRPGYTHNAVDIGGLGSYGAPVGAAAPGKVAAAVHNDTALGNYVTLEHDDGSRTVYGHLSEIYVEPGQRVDAAEPLGALGCTGHSTGTHLHFELWIGGAPVDPLDYLP